MLSSFFNIQENHKKLYTHNSLEKNRKYISDFDYLLSKEIFVASEGKYRRKAYCKYCV